MRGLFIAALTVLGPMLPSQAHAQALHLSGRTHATSENSCSQSWAMSSEAASFTVDVSAQEAVTLTIDRTHRSTMGSQPMFGDGASSPPTVIQEHAQVTLTGTAQRGARTLDLHMTAMTLATARWQGEGTLPLGAETTRAVTLDIHCDASPVVVFEVAQYETQQPLEGAPSHTETLYVCRFTDPASAGWSAFLSVYSEHVFPLATRPVVRVESDGPFREEPFYRLVR